MSNEVAPLETGSISDTASAVTSADSAIVHPRRAWVALTSAVVLVALGSMGYVNPGNFVWIERLFDHVFVFGVIAALLTGWGLGLLTRRRCLRTTLLVPAVIVACL